MIPEWLEISPESGNGNGKITLSAGPNIGLDREASVAVTDSNGKMKTLRISQTGILTVVADMVNPSQRMYTTVQSDELYDNFDKIARFDIGFSGFLGADGERLVIDTDYFSEDGTNCFSEIIPKDKYGLLFDFRIAAGRNLVDNNLKLIQLAPIMVST